MQCRQQTGVTGRKQLLAGHYTVVSLPKDGMS